MCWRECGKKETPVHHWWDCKLVQPLWKTVWRFLKKLKIEPPYEPAILLLGMYPKNTNTNSKRYMHTYVHSSIIFFITAAFFFYLFFILFIFDCVGSLFLCAGFLWLRRGGLLFVAVCGLLIVVASLVVEHRL